ncbi:MAG: pyroglutamyl-peptidase I, partial [Clostridia bacterium]|nr:pyroglutamyl-peptidase I [Clostridia bacterium]
RQVIHAAEKAKPDVILCIGQAGGRDAVTPEMAALNLRFASIADNEGNHPQDEPVVPGGPAAYFSTVPVRKIAQAIHAASLPGKVSYSAGTFVCNDLFYSLLHHYSGTPVRVGFIHVPYLPSQGQPSLSLEETVHALTLAISALQE